MAKNIIQLHELNPLEFKMQLAKIIRIEFEDFWESKRNKTKTEWLSRKEIIKLLKVSEPTIIDWDKKGILKPYKIGNRIRYKLSEIENVLESSRA